MSGIEYLRFPDLPGALCVRVDSEIFFPETGEGIALAASICAACDVREACLEWALDHNEKHGVWAGTGQKQRERLRRQRREAAA